MLPDSEKERHVNGNINILADSSQAEAHIEALTGSGRSPGFYRRRRQPRLGPQPSSR
jgi:hypothetical protein